MCRYFAPSCVIVTPHARTQCHCVRTSGPTRSRATGLPAENCRLMPGKVATCLERTAIPFSDRKCRAIAIPRTMGPGPIEEYARRAASSRLIGLSPPERQSSRLAARIAAQWFFASRTMPVVHQGGAGTVPTRSTAAGSAPSGRSLVNPYELSLLLIIRFAVCNEHESPKCIFLRPHVTMKPDVVVHARRHAVLFRNRQDGFPAAALFRNAASRPCSFSGRRKLHVFFGA